MQNRLTIVIGALSALVIIVVIVVAVRLSHHASPQLQTAAHVPPASFLSAGNAAPEIRVASTDGYFDLDAQRRPVLVEIFASWCPHCQRETVVMNKLFQAFKSRIAFIAIPGSAAGMDGRSPESASDLVSFIARFNVQYPVAVFDPQLTTANAYLLNGYPTIAVVGTNKKILFIDSGEIPYERLAGVLKKAR